MNYFIVYHKDNQVLKEIYSSADKALAEIHANLTAYTNNYEVASVCNYDINKLLKKSINNYRLLMFKLSCILKYRNDSNKIILNNLSEMFIADGLIFNEEYINNNTIQQKLILDNLEILFYGKINIYGIIKCKKIEIYNNKKLVNKEYFN